MCWSVLNSCTSESPIPNKHLLHIVIPILWSSCLLQPQWNPTHEHPCITRAVATTGLWFIKVERSLPSKSARVTWRQTLTWRFIGRRLEFVLVLFTRTALLHPSVGSSLYKTARGCLCSPTATTENPSSELKRRCKYNRAGVYRDKA